MDDDYDRYAPCPRCEAITNATLDFDGIGELHQCPSCGAHFEMHIEDSGDCVGFYTEIVKPPSNI